jgi:salicylate hydroxylase
MGSSFAFCDVRALYLSLEKSAKLVLRASSITTSGAKVIGYDIPYALHLYDETRRYFLQRVQRQLSHDQLDLKYVAEAGDETEALRRYRETFTINWWMLEHDVDARWQEVECQERHRRLKPVEDLELKFANRL